MLTLCGLTRLAFSGLADAPLNRPESCDFIPGKGLAAAEVRQLQGLFIGQHRLLSIALDYE
jgi:hypothetical protein